MTKEVRMLNKLLKLAKPSSGSDCCGVEIVEEVDEPTESGEATTPSTSSEDPAG